ncbi:MAG: putative lipid II flippase FtsW [Nitrospira sp.]|nr:putative lipid II flippase FtsW [Nitrospira sp.]MCA9478797.1 putative lipid II flippase FtsW [Nitrospira sp.]
MAFTSLLRRRNAHRDISVWADLFEDRTTVGRQRVDPLILGITLAIALGGVVMVFSASGVLGETSTYYLQRQIIWMALGFCVLFGAMNVPYAKWKAWAPVIILLCVMSLALVLGMGTVVNRARRWFSLGFFSVQPTEMAKLGVVLYLAAYLSNPNRRMTDWQQGLLPPLLVVGVICGLIVVEPDLGSTVVIGLVFLSMVYLAGARLLHLAILGMPLVAAFGGLIWISPERVERFMTFWDPWPVRDGAGYQLVQSLISLKHGGVFGVGLGQGQQKLLYLPEGHTDFVFALIGEELGLMGTSGLLALFAILVFKGFRVAALAPDLFGRYLALGITLLVGFQALINVGVVCGMLPTKGLTLPLVSYGGSSLLTTMLAIGILLSIARQGRVPARE